MSSFKTIYSLLLLLFLTLGCQEQDVISELKGDVALLSYSVDGNGQSFFGKVDPDALYEKEITLTNTGGFNISNITAPKLELPYSYKGGSYPGEFATCSDSLAPNESCTIKITLFSEEAIDVNFNFNLNYNNGVNEKTLSLPMSTSIANVANLIYAVGEILDPEEIELNTGRVLRFPRTSIGHPKEITVSFANNGHRDLTLKSIPQLATDQDYLGGDFPGTNGTCSLIIKSGEICTMAFQYTPALIGQISQDVFFNYNNGVEDINYQIAFFTDTIDDKANVRINGPALIDYGNIPQNTEKTVQTFLTNDTVLDALNLSVTVSNTHNTIEFNGGSYPGTNGTCSSALGSFQNCILDFKILSNNLGTISENLTINYNDNHILTPVDVSKTTPLAMNIVTLGKLELIEENSIPNTTPTTFPPNAPGTNTKHILTFKNTGQYPISMVSASLLNDPTQTIQVIIGGSCGATVTTLANDETCTIRLQSASEVTGNFSGDLKLEYNNGAANNSRNDSIEIPITSTFVDVSNLSYSPLTYIEFGDVLTQKTSTQKSITLQNTGSGDATNLVFDFASLSSSAFTLNSTTCGATLLSNSSCELNFTVTPTTTGSIFHSIDFTYTDLQSDHILNLVLKANSKTAANLVLRRFDGTQMTTIDFMDSPANKAATMSVNIANVGGLAAKNISAIINSNPNFSITKNGSCGNITNFTIYGGEACSFEVTFQPDSLAVFNENLSLNYHNGDISIADTYLLEGEGTSSGLLEMLGVQRFTVKDLGSIVAGTVESFNFDLINNGTADVTDFVLSTLPDKLSWGINTCNSTIIPGGTCQVELIYSPLIQESQEFNINYSYNSSKSVKNFNFPVVVQAKTPPDLFINFTGPQAPNRFDFGETPYLVSDYIQIKITNTGASPAKDMSLAIDQASFNSFSIISTNCPQGSELTGGGACDVVIAYSPEDQSIHTGKLLINYTGYGNEVLPLEVSLKGTGIDPLANFKGWYEIYAASEESDGELRLRWNTSIPTSSSITIDGYKVYMSEGTPLPNKLDDLSAFEVKSISGDSLPLREYSISNTPLGTTYYIKIRPTYLGQVMNTTDESGDLKIMTPPKHMSLIHPYMVNQEVCNNMSAEILSEHKLGCVFSGDGNIGGYFNFNKYLYIDRYELSQNSSATFENLPNKTPVEISNQIIAANACKEISVDFQGQTISKRLTRRSEFVAAAAWPPNLTQAEIEARENANGVNDCVLKQENPTTTGSASNCISRYGAYDMVGNVWEWNSDQTNNSIGWTSGVDTENDESFGVNMGGIFPGLLTDLPCFNFALGIAQNFVPEICPNGVQISETPSLFTTDYYFPPVMTGIKPVRSGGGVGVDGSFNARKAGRWVADYNSSMSNAVQKTGARCSFSLPLE